MVHAEVVHHHIVCCPPALFHQINDEFWEDFSIVTALEYVRPSLTLKIPVTEIECPLVSGRSCFIPLLINSLPGFIHK